METVIGIMTALVAVMILVVSLGVLALVITGRPLPQIPRPKPRVSSRPAALVATINPDMSSDSAADGVDETEARSADDEATAATMIAEPDVSTLAADQHDAHDSAVTEADEVDTTLVDSIPRDDSVERTAMASEVDSAEPIPLAAPEESASEEEEMDRPSTGRSAKRSLGT